MSSATIFFLILEKLNLVHHRRDEFRVAAITLNIPSRYKTCAAVIIKIKPIFQTTIPYLYIDLIKKCTIVYICILYIIYIIIVIPTKTLYFILVQSTKGLTSNK